MVEKDRMNQSLLPGDDELCSTATSLGSFRTALPQPRAILVLPKTREAAQRPSGSIAQPGPLPSAPDSPCASVTGGKGREKTVFNGS